MKKFFPILVLIFIVVVFFRPFFLQGKLPIPADTIVGLYHPFRDLYAKDYPRGIPFKNFLITDPVRQQYPWKSIALAIEKRGELPLWNPYNMAGAPLLGSMQSGAFYPLNFLLFLLPFSLGWSFLIFIQQILAGFFLYLYLKNLKLSQSASLLGSITYAFCGFFIAWLEWGTVIHTAIWIPLVMLAIDKLVLSIKYKVSDISKKGIFLWSLIFIFSLVSAFFAGHLQTFFYLYLLATVYFLARWFQLGRNRSVLFLYVILNTLYLILTSIQWFPTLQLILQSARDIDQVSWQKEGWFIPWQNLTQFVSPDFFGNPATLNYFGVWNYGEFVGYVGMLSLVMAFFALFFRPDKKTLFFGSLLFISLLFALSTLFAKIPYMLQIPFLKTAQPTRLLFLVDFSLAVLSALGFDYYLRHKNRTKVFYPLMLVGIILLSLWVFVLGGYKSAVSVSAENIMVMKRNLYLPTILFSALLFIFILKIFIKNKLISVSLVCMLLALSIFDLLRFSEKFTPFTDKSYLFPQTEALSFLKKDTSVYRIMSTDSQILPPNFSAIYQIQSLEGYDPLYLRRYGELIAAIERNKPDVHAPFGFNRIITPRNIDSRLIDMLGVKYVLSLSEINSSKYEKVFTEGQTKIYKNKEVFPRVFLVAGIKPVANEQEAINNLFDKQVDLKKIAVVEDWNNEITARTFTSGTANIFRYTENQIIISTNSQPSTSNAQLFLVLTDTFYPTWHAKVCLEGEKECKDAKIYRTNYNFRGIIIPQGKRTVVFYNTLL